jgi:hypothetical protein
MLPVPLFILSFSNSCSSFHTRNELTLYQAIMDILVCIFALYRAVRTPDMTDLAVAMFTLSGLWLAAFVLAVLRYHKSACGASGHDGLDNPDNCTLKKMHIAFTFVAL